MCVNTQQCEKYLYLYLVGCQLCDFTTTGQLWRLKEHSVTFEN